MYVSETTLPLRTKESIYTEGLNLDASILSNV